MIRLAVFWLIIAGIGGCVTPCHADQMYADGLSKGFQKGYLEGKADGYLNAGGGVIKDCVRYRL